MFNTKIKIVLIAAVILFVAVIISGAVSHKTDAQVDVGVCQEEYNASRSKCITDNTACVAACGGNQTCELDCNTAKRNACDDAAVARQKECLGADNSASEKPVSSIQPDVAIDCQSTYDRDRAVCQNTANACYNSCKNGLSDNYWACIETCTSRNTNCGKEARYKLSVCGLDAQPPAAKPMEQPPTQTMPPPKIGVDAGDDSDDPEDRNCRVGYDSARKACQDAVFACYDSCNRYDPGYYACMDVCTARNRDCIKAANDQYSACAATSPASPDMPSVDTPIPTASQVLSSLPEEIIVDGTFYSIALVDASTKNDLKKMVSAVTGPSPEVSITLKSESPTVVFTAGRDAGIDSNAFVPDPYNFLLNTSNLAIVQPTIIFNDGAEDKFSIDVGKLMKSLEASNADTLEVDTNSFLQKKITEIMEQNPPTKTATFSISKTSAKPLVILSPAEALTGSISSPPTYSWDETISAGTSFVAHPGSLVVLDADTVNANRSVTVGGSAADSQTQDFDDKTMSRAGFALEVKTGKMIVVVGWSAEDTLSSVSDFVSALDTVEVRHHKTAFGMAIDPDSGKKIIEIYDGEIDVFDRKTGVALAALSTEFGKDIKRVEIDKDGVVKWQIAIPKSEWPAFVAEHQKTGTSTWLYIFLILIIGAAAYFGYRKKDAIIKFIKKEPKQSP